MHKKMGVLGGALDHKPAKVKKTKAYWVVLAKVQAADQRKLFFPSIWHLGECILSTVPSFGCPSIKETLLYWKKLNRKAIKTIRHTCCMRRGW